MKAKKNWAILIIMTVFWSIFQISSAYALTIDHTIYVYPADGAKLAPGTYASAASAHVNIWVESSGQSSSILFCLQAGLDGQRGDCVNWTKHISGYYDTTQPIKADSSTIAYSPLLFLSEGSHIAYATLSWDIYPYAIGTPDGVDGTWPSVPPHNFSVAPVPKPSTLLLLGSGLAAAIGFGRKRLFKGK